MDSHENFLYSFNTLSCLRQVFLWAGKIFSKTCNRILFWFGVMGLVAALAVPAQASFYHWKIKFYTIKSEHFLIHFQENLGPVATEVRDIAEVAYERLTQRFNWKPAAKINLIITDKSDVSNGLATVIPDNYVTLYVAPPQANSSLDHYRDYLELLVNHELTHIIHIDQYHRWAEPARWIMGKVAAPNGLTPAWLREGVAVWQESKLDENYGRANSDYTEMVLRTSYLENRFPRIDQIAGLSHAFPGGNGPYLFGGDFHKWLGEKYGEERIYKFQEEYSSGLWLFSLNNKARRVFGKSFYKLWKEFKQEKSSEYEQRKKEISALGLTQIGIVKQDKKSYASFVARPNSTGYAYFERNDDDPSKIIIVPEQGQEPITIRRSLFGQLAFSATGRYLAFSSLSSVEPKTVRSEVFYYDLTKRRLFRVYDQGYQKKSMRAMDPAFSPMDGGNRWMVMVRAFGQTDQLYIYDTFEKRGYVITQAPQKTQFSNPRFSPDGTRIIVSRKDPNGQRDIYIYSNLGMEIKQITNDVKVDNHPVFAGSGEIIYYDSFKSGVSNIYEYNLATGVERQVTNVLTGVFQPAPAADDQSIFVQVYSSENNWIGNIPKSGFGSFATFEHNSPQPTEPPVLHKDVKQKPRRKVSFNYQSGDYETLLAFEQPAARDDLDEQFSFDNSETTFFEEDFTVSVDEHLVSAMQMVVPDNHEESAEHIHDADSTPLRQMLMQQENKYAARQNKANPYHRFAMNPDSPEFLPNAADDDVYSGQQNRRRREQSDDDTENSKNKKSEDTHETDEQEKWGSRRTVSTKLATTNTEGTAKNKIYPSAYKDALSAFPHDSSVDKNLPQGARPYHALPGILMPKYLIPSLMTYESAMILGVATGKFDPLYRHAWTVAVNYRSDAQFVGGTASYLYTRYDPTFYLGVVRYVVDWGDVNGVTFFEQRTQGYAGVAYSYKKNAFNLSYFYEDRSALTNIAGVNLVNMQPYAGLRATYTFTDYKKYPNSISQERGYKVKIGGEFTNSILGSDEVNEGEIAYFDARAYLEMPWSDHHVLALRAAVGWQWGDLEQFGAFRLGGPFGEGVGAGYSSRVFPMRGLSSVTFGGDQVVLFSAEYRIPLLNDINRGIGTWPIFMDKLYMNIFSDAADIKYRTETASLFSRMLVSAGGELKGDFSFGYGLPLTMRLGYGVIFTNTGRLAGVVDPTFGTDIKYGNAYLQVGTSF